MIYNNSRQNAVDIRYGNHMVQKVYQGNHLVWERCSPLVEIMVGSGSIIETFDNYLEMRYFVGRYIDERTFYVLIRKGDTIPDDAFSGLYNVQPVVFQTTIKKIGSKAFSGCSLISSIDLSSVSTIGSYAFQSCRGLRNFRVYGGITNIPEGLFYACFNLLSVEIDSGVKTIGSRAFQACHSLSSVSMPQSLTHIGEDAFGNCYDLKEITIPQNVVSIGNNAFYDSGIRTIRINKPSGSILGSPWGATNATILWTG